MANCLRRIGGIDIDKNEVVMEPIMGMEVPYYYRNKSQYPVGYDKEEIWSQVFMPVVRIRSFPAAIVRLLIRQAN